MVDQSKRFYDNFSFFTQSVLVGRDKKGHEIWKELIEQNKSGWPRWTDWARMRDDIIRPLCDVATSVAVWYEWRSDRRELAKLKRLVEEHVQKRGRYQFVENPNDLVDEPLFWIGGGRDFTLVQVMNFELKSLEIVLTCLAHYRQAGKTGSRYSKIFNSVYRYAKSSVKNGEFAVIFSGDEAEIFVPVDCKEKTEKVARDVDARHTAEMGWD